MLTLPTKFALENSRCPNDPCYIVKMQEDIVRSEKKLRSDWAAGSGLYMDIDSQPDKMLIFEAALDTLTQTYWNQSGLISDGATNYAYWQSFLTGQSGSRVLKSITIYLTADSKTGWASAVTMAIWNPAKTVQLGVVEVTGIYHVTSQAYTFNFEPQNITLDNTSQYWILIAGIAPIPEEGGWNNVYFDYHDTTVPVYTDGALYHGVPIIGDLKFSMVFLSASGHYYYTDGYLALIFDLASTPTGTGELRILDSVPTGTTATYHLYSSPTGAFTGEQTDLGVQIDGYQITTNARYYQIYVYFYANTARDQSPILSSLSIDFSNFRSYSDRHQFGYEPAVVSVSALDSKIDDFAATTIGQISLTMADSFSISEYIVARYPKSKTVKIYAGFSSDGFTESDFMLYASGQISDWKKDSSGKWNFTLKSYSVEWDKDVPESWIATSDDVNYSGWHPIDVCIDIIKVYCASRSSKINYASFATVKAALPGWTVDRIITGDPEKAQELLEELRKLMSCYFIFAADGSVKIKRYSSTESAVFSITDANARITSPWDGNAKTLVNRQVFYYGWRGTGDDAEDFAVVSVVLNATSHANWDEWADGAGKANVRDKWTVDSAQGAIQVDARTDMIDARYQNPPNVITAVMFRDKIAFETGDMALVTTTQAPSTDGTGITAQKYQVVRRNFAFEKNEITFDLLKV